jgi:hypothetical protein
MIAAFVMFFTYHDAERAQLTPDQLYSSKIVKPPLYYIAHATQITLLFTAGILAWLSIGERKIERGYGLQFMLFIGASALMAARGYSLSDLLSTKIVDVTGPFVCWISVLVFIGAQRSNWIFLEKLLEIMAVLFSAVVVLGVAGLGTFTRQEAVANLGGALSGLYWPAAWIALRAYPQASYVRRVRFVPIMIFAIGSFFTQSRLPVIMLFALLLMYSYVQYKRKQPQAAVWIAGLTLAVFAGLFTATFLRDTRGFGQMESIADAFISRIDEDTRTGQLVAFAESVQPHELLLGRGSLATWQWGGTPWGGTDVGYLTLLFYGGVPLLITYITVHLNPCFRALKMKQPSWQLTPAAIVFLWAIRMFSSSYPSVSIEYYPVLFCVGACISREGRGGRY